jgi:sigma54-dependent transcription regulator
MSARKFDSLFLFHTPHTRENAVATSKEIATKHPTCQVSTRELAVSDPKDYSSLMGCFCRQLRDLTVSPTSHVDFVSPRILESVRASRSRNNYVCVSSGTAEMRAAWFLVTALGLLPAKLLQVGSPAYPLFGEANVKEVQIDTTDWETIRNLLTPAAYFGMPRAVR